MHLPSTIEHLVVAWEEPRRRGREGYRSQVAVQRFFSLFRVEDACR